MTSKQMARSPWLADAATGATGATYEIRTVADFLKVPLDRRRICLREFHSWMAMQDGVTDLLLATSEGMDGGLSRDDLHWQTDVFVWNDDGLATICVQLGRVWS